MSAAAVSPAPSPAPGPAVASGAQGRQDRNAKTGFDVILVGLAGGQDPAGGDAPLAADPATRPATASGPKTSGKTTVTGKGASVDGKAKADSDGKTSEPDTAPAAPGATVALDPSQTALLPVLPDVALQATAVAAGAADAAAAAATTAQAAVTTAADQGAGQTAAAALAKLGADQVAGSAGAATDQTQTAVPADLAAAADAAATDATATARITVTATKTDAATPQAAPQTTVPAPAAAAPAAAAAATPPVPVQTPDTSAPAAVATLEAAPTDPRVTPPEAVKPTPAKGSRVDVTAKIATTASAPSVVATAASASSAKAADALQTLTDDAPKPGLEGGAQGPALDSKTEAAADPVQAPANPATSATTTPATLVQAAAVAVRGAPQTVANLAAQIVKKLEGRSSQFNVQLDPAGLGKVDVRIAIGADGRMSAAMSFDTPQAAAELKSRSNELQKAMEQAGFDLSGGMSFDVASDQGQGGQAQHQQADAGAHVRGRAFQAALDTTADASPSPQLMLRRTALAGVDVRI